MSEEIEAPEPPKIVNVEDLIPVDSEFVVVVNGKPETIFVRAITLDDHVWFKKTFGHNANALLGEDGEIDAEKVCKITYRLMNQEGKKLFPAEAIEEIDDNGRVITRVFTGPERLRQCLPWPQGILELTKTLMQVIGLSNPVLDELDLEVLKKNDPIVGTPSEVRTGVASTMQWPESTGTPSTNLDG